MTKMNSKYFIQIMFEKKNKFKYEIGQQVKVLRQVQVHEKFIV